MIATEKKLSGKIKKSNNNNSIHQTSDSETTLKGRIGKVQNISGTAETEQPPIPPIEEDDKLDGTIDKEQSMSGIIDDTPYGPVEKYDGPYQFIPLPFEEIIIPTRGTVVYRNMKILEIPYYKTSNESGYTVYIGGD